MGSGRENASAAAEAGLATSQVGAAQDRRFSTEEQLRSAEALLGTDTQVNGQLFNGMTNEQVQRGLPYAGSYQLDENYLRTLEGPTGYGYKNLLAQGIDTGKFARLSDYARSITTKANDLVTQARFAAVAGDTAKAQALKTQADQLFAKAAPGLTANVGLDKGVTFKQDEDLAARAQLMNPQAQIVGSQLKRSRDLLNPDSEASKEYLRNQTISGDRSIAREANQAKYEARNASSQLGGARNLFQESALNSQIHSATGLARAELHQQAQQSYETFRDSFAKDSVSFANQWLQGGSFIRESYQQASDNLAAMAANIFMTESQRYADMAKSPEAKKPSAAAAIGSLVGGLIGYKVGGMPGAQAGSQIGGQIGSATSKQQSGGGGGGGGGSY